MKNLKTATFETEDANKQHYEVPTEFFLKHLGNKLKSDIIEHKNFIGGRYSVLSEVGMIPSELVGFKTEKFKKLNHFYAKCFFI